MRDDEHDGVFESFVRDLRELVRKEENEDRLTGLVAERLSRLYAQKFELPAAVRIPDKSRYIMYPLHVEEGRFSVASAVWDVGQATPIHDHGTWGVIGVWEGEEEEIRYAEPSTSGAEPPLAVEERKNRVGDITVCCTSRQDIHRVRCTSSRPCIGIHVYGGDIGSIVRRSYDPETGATKEFVSAWPRQGRA